MHKSDQITGLAPLCEWYRREIEFKLLILFRSMFVEPHSRRLLWNDKRSVNAASLFWTSCGVGKQVIYSSHTATRSPRKRNKKEDHCGNRRVYETLWRISNLTNGYYRGFKCCFFGSTLFNPANEAQSVFSIIGFSNRLIKNHTKYRFAPHA